MSHWWPAPGSVAFLTLLMLQLPTSEHCPCGHLLPLAWAPTPVHLFTVTLPISLKLLLFTLSYPPVGIFSPCFNTHSGQLPGEDIWKRMLGPVLWTLYSSYVYILYLEEVPQLYFPISLLKFSFESIYFNFQKLFFVLSFFYTILFIFCG